MSAERLLLDTVYIEAILNARDRYHQAALQFLSRVRTAHEVWVTEAVLQEVGAALSGSNRNGAALFMRACYTTANIHVVSIDRALFLRGLTLYEARPDKQWSLTDCLSFVVMEENNLTDAVTADHHFMQASFRALLQTE